MDPWQPPQQHPQPLTPKRQNQIQGPRPTPLKVSKDSVKIKKPPKHPQHYPQPPPQPYVQPRDGNQPVIIYSVSPKPYFVEPSDFRSLVQHLTGRDVASPIGEPPVSPAARFAALERTSPKERDRWWGGGGGGAGGDGSDVVNMTSDVELISQMPGIFSPGPGNFSGILSPGFGSFSGVLSPAPGNFPGVVSPAFGSLPGILSPAPGNLPVIPPGMFSPAGADGAGFSGLNELNSPFMSNFGGFLQSPSNLLFANNNVPFVSPSPTTDFYNIFDL